MYEVSEAYKIQMRQRVRNYSYMRIRFALTNPDADRDAAIVDNGHMDWSNEPDLIDTREVTSRYASLELNRWIFGGPFKTLPNSSPYDYQGFVGNVVSDKQGNYITAATITITFDEGIYNFRGLTFVFDSISGNYPSQLTVSGILQNETVYEKTFDVDDYNFVINEQIPGLESYVDTLVLTYPSSSLPYRRVRVESIVLGLQKVIDGDSITQTKWSRTNDIMNTVLPDESFSYTFYDKQKEYNPDNTEGVWEYVETGQQVRFDYGYLLDDGTIEWVPGSKYYVDGSPEVSNGGTLSQVSFNTVSRIQTLTDVYDEGVYSATGKSFYDLAVEVLNWAGVLDRYGEPMYVLDESLKAYRTTAPLPVMPAKELLQLIANAGMCIMYTDREGYLVLKQRNTTNSGFGFTLDDIKDATPTVNKYPYLKDIYLSVVVQTPDTVDNQLTSLEVIDADNTELTLEYPAATDISVSADGGLTLVGIVGLYAYRAKVVVSGTGKITVNGKHLIENSYTVSRNFNPVGDDCSLTNQLITDKIHAIAYIQWMSEILLKRNVYDFSDRGFPEVDIADNITLDTAFTEAKEAVVTSATVTFNGSIKGNTEVLG